MDRSKINKACELLEEARAILIGLIRAEGPIDDETEEGEELAMKVGSLEEVSEGLGSAMDELESIDA